MTTPASERIDGERFCFPDFQPGQVLSHRDLNLLRDYAYTKSMFQNRSLFGYGVACGLRGSIQANTQLAITPGFGLSADGRELRLDEGFVIDLDAITEMQADDFATHPEVGTAEGVEGYTPLLVRDDSVHAGECGDDCTSEAETVCEGTRIVFARGRLSRGPLQDHPIFRREPLAPNKDFSISNSRFRALRNALVQYLRPLLGEATVSLLAEQELDGTPAHNMMRLGLLNEVLYACWGHARCQAQQAASCFRPGTENALALGWLHRAGPNWRWDRHYRHHFELAPALYTAIFGMRGQDLCGQYLDRIRSMLQAFVVPEPPPPDTTPPEPDGPIHICDIAHLKRRDCWWFPGPVIPIPDVRDPWPIDPSDPRGPWFDIGPIDPGVVYPGPILDQEIDFLDVYGSGAIRLAEYIGRAGQATGTAIGEAIGTQKGIEPDVRVLPVNEIAGISGFEPSLVVSSADVIVLGVNESGAVVATGSVPAGRSMRDAGTRIPGLQDAADRAVSDSVAAVGTANSALEQLGTVNARVDVMESETIATLQQQFSGLQQSWDGLLQELPALDELHETLAGYHAFTERVADVERDLGIQSARINTLDAVAHGVEARLEAERVRNEDRLGTVNRRVDMAMGTGHLEVGAGVRVQDINRGFLELVESMQQAMVQAAPEDRRAHVEETLAGTSGDLNILRTASQDPNVLVTNRTQEMVHVMEGMVAGLQAMGAADTQIADFQGRLNNFSGMLGI